MSIKTGRALKRSESLFRLVDVEFDGDLHFEARGRKQERKRNL